MKIIDARSNKLYGREAPNSSAIECDACNEHFLWERGRGDRVKCPECGKEEVLDFSVAKPIDGLTEAEQTAAQVDPAQLNLQLTAAQTPAPPEPGDA